MNILIFLFSFFCVTVFAKEPFLKAAYLESWYKYTNPGFDIKKIDEKELSDLYIAFARFDESYTFYPLEEDDLYDKLHALKSSLRLIISVGGQRFENTLFSKMVKSPASRQKFISSALDFLKKHHFDGLDVDWEFPNSSEFDLYLTFLKECREVFAKEGMILSVCLPPWPVDEMQATPDTFFSFFKEAAEVVDRVTLMTYNYHTSDGEEKVTGINAPLVDNDLSITKTAAYMEKFAVPFDKVLLGIPLYGWAWPNVEGMSEHDVLPGKVYTKQEGFSYHLPYNEIIKMIEKNRFNFKIDKRKATAYGYNLNKKIWISFDTPETRALKMKYALDRGFLGVIFWAINQEQQQVL